MGLDDFGKGYSSLSYIRELPISALKIDKFFIDGIGESKDVTDSIIIIAHKIGLKVIAEGVEQKDQYEYLERNKCDLISYEP